jgi:hypothetical protein
VKKLLLVAAGAVAAVIAARKVQGAQHEQQLWAEATDAVKKHS